MHTPDTSLYPTMDHQSPSEGPALGIVNAEAITDAIQSCHVSLEEVRLRLTPLMKILEEDADGNDANRSDEYTDDHHIVQVFIEGIEHVFGSIDLLMVRLADSGLVPLHKGNEDDVYLLMASNCISKSCEFIGHHLLTLLEADSLEGPGPLDDHSGNSNTEGGGFRIQPCMARLTELALRVLQIQSTLAPPSNKHANVDEGEEIDDEEEITPETIAEAYSQYQRRCLRTRSKPAISSVAELRRVASSQNCYVSDLLEAESRRQQLEDGLHHDDDDDDDNGEDIDGGGGADSSRGQPHAQAITVILGEASSLIQPLAAWRDALSPQIMIEIAENDNVGSLLQQLCQESIELLDNEAQTLAVTVGSWFTTDQRGVATLEQHHETSNNDIMDASKSDLLSIESSLEEMAFLCQVISRYCLFSEQTLSTEVTSSNNNNNDSKKLQNLLTEQSLHYSTLETRLATLQFNQALSLVSPQLIELGRPLLQVPSIVEDAHYVCVRAIERAAGTRSERAVWTVGHWVCEVWGVDPNGGMMVGGGDDGVKGVYRALMEGIGCTGGGNTIDNDDNKKSADDILGSPAPKVENAFAAALLEELDDGIDHNIKKGGPSPPRSAPASGGLTSFFGRGDKSQTLQNRIDAELCALNGISAAETACSALSRLFADLIEEKLQEQGDGSSNATEGNAKSTSMLAFAMDELASHSRSYSKLLQQRVRVIVADLCGGDDLFDCDGRLCLGNLRLFIEKEVYNLDSTSFQQLEGGDRLESIMLGPVRRSQIFEEIGKDKCDSAVVLQMAEAMSWKSAEIVLQVLFKSSVGGFNEWGAMLLSKQIRMLQNIYCGLVLDSVGGPNVSAAEVGTTASVSTASILTQFERVSQAVSILQLEKPSDWLAFAYKVGDSDETNLSSDEIQKIMSLRIDFSEESIARVCMQMN